MLSDLLQHCNPRKLSRVKTSHGGKSSRWWGAWPFIPFRMRRMRMFWKRPMILRRYVIVSSPPKCTPRNGSRTYSISPYSNTKEKEDQNIRCSSTKKRNFKSCWCSESRCFPTFSVDFRPHLWRVDKVEALRVLLAHPSEANKQNHEFELELFRYIFFHFQISVLSCTVFGS